MSGKRLVSGLTRLKYATDGGYDPILQMKKLKLRDRAALFKLGFESYLLKAITSPPGGC